jgi:hypothetical protein
MWSMNRPEDRAARLTERRRKRVEAKLRSRRITPLGDDFFEVQSGRGGTHVVALTEHRTSCSDCPHFDKGLGPCDHILMVRSFIVDGQPVELAPELRMPRSQTPRDWPFYKAYRRLIPGVVEFMLRDLVTKRLGSTRFSARNVGRPRLSTQDVIICANARRMHRGSGLEVDRLVREYHSAGWLLHPESPCEDAISGALRRKEVAETYMDLIGFAANPLRDKESVFAIDAQSWRTPCSLYDVHVYDAETRQKRWRKGNVVKLQIALGTTWKIVGAVAILSEEDGEVPQTKNLVKTVSERFGTPKMLLCDAAYSAGPERQWLSDQGIDVRIPFKGNSKLQGDGSAWDFDLENFFMRTINTGQNTMYDRRSSRTSAP